MSNKMPVVQTGMGPQSAIPVYVIGQNQSLTSAMTPLGYRQVNLPSSGVTKFADIPESARFALIRAEGAGFRYRDDGVDPTATEGMPVEVGESMVYDALMTDIRVIAQASGAIVNIAFYGERNED